MTRDPIRATARQREALHDILRDVCDVPYERIENMTYQEASEIIGWNARNWRNFPPTRRQETFLRNWGRWREGLNLGEASDLIGEVKERLARMTPGKIELVKREVQMGGAGSVCGS